MSLALSASCAESFESLTIDTPLKREIQISIFTQLFALNKKKVQTINCNKTIRVMHPFPAAGK